MDGSVLAFLNCTDGPYWPTLMVHTVPYCPTSGFPLNLVSLDFHSWGFLWYHGYYARKATKNVFELEWLFLQIDKQFAPFSELYYNFPCFSEFTTKLHLSSSVLLSVYCLYISFSCSLSCPPPPPPPPSSSPHPLPPYVSPTSPGSPCPPSLYSLSSASSPSPPTPHPSLSSAYSPATLFFFLLLLLPFLPWIAWYEYSLQPGCLFG